MDSTLAGQSESTNSIGDHFVNPLKKRTGETVKFHTVGLTVAICIGVVVFIVCIQLDYYLLRDTSVTLLLPNSVQVTYFFCATAYACSGISNVCKLLVETSQMRRNLHFSVIYISFLAFWTYALLSLELTTISMDIKAVLFIPSRWLLYVATMPAVWWILHCISNYPLRRTLYVLWLNFVMLVAGGMATIPCISWGHKVYWMALSCAPFPELCFHLWQMMTDAIDIVDESYCSRAPLQFLRIYGQFAYQFFPAIYFAAFDGVIPLYVSEPLWACCDWCLKMVMTNCLMEANFLTSDQRRIRMQLIERCTRTEQDIVKLSAAIQAQDHFLASISHEFCTPLNGIIGLSQALVRGSPSRCSGEVQRLISIIRQSGEGLLKLVHDMLDMSKLAEGVMMLKVETVDLQVLIPDVANLTANLVHSSVQFNLQVKQVPAIRGDSCRIAQVLYNLIGNACKFTSTGHITVATHYQESMAAVGFSVADTGKGISQNNIHSIFDAYNQGEMSTALEFGGTGLGLHIVKDIVQAHRGIIEVSSVIGLGSKFTIWLPIHHGTGLNVGPNGKPEDVVRVLTYAAIGTNSGSTSETITYQPRQTVQEPPSTTQPTLSPGRPASFSSGDDTGSRTEAALGSGTMAGAYSEEPALGDAPAAQPAPEWERLLLRRKMQRQALSMRATGSVEAGDDDSNGPVAPELPGEEDSVEPGVPSPGAPSYQPRQPQPPHDCSTERTYSSVTFAGCHVDEEPEQEAFVPLCTGEVDGAAAAVIAVDVSTWLYSALHAEGFELIACTSGAAALEALGKQPLLPDAVVVCDSITDMRTDELVLKLRQKFDYVAVPIIVVSRTASAFKSNVEAGCTDFTSRDDCTPQQLLWRVHNQISRRQCVKDALLCDAVVLQPSMLRRIPMRMREDVAIRPDYDGTTPIVGVESDAVVVHVSLSITMAEEVSEETGVALCSALQSIHQKVVHLAVESTIYEANNSPCSWTFLVCDQSAEANDARARQFAAKVLSWVSTGVDTDQDALVVVIGLARGSTTIMLGSVAEGLPLLLLSHSAQVAAQLAEKGQRNCIALMAAASHSTYEKVAWDITGVGVVSVCQLSASELGSFPYADHSSVDEAEDLASAVGIKVPQRWQGMDIDIIETSASDSEVTRQSADTQQRVGSLAGESQHGQEKGRSGRAAEEASGNLSDPFMAAQLKMQDIDLPHDVQANLPTLADVFASLGMVMPHELAKQGADVVLVSFASVQDLQGFNLERQDALRVLKACKDVFADALESLSEVGPSGHECHSPFD